MIRVENLTVELGNFSVRNVSFHIQRGQYVALMGKTGSGKTTVLESICGLRKVSAGKILLDGRDATNLSAAARGVGYVPQDAALFTTMTIRDHLGFAPKIRNWDPAQIEERVDELAKLLEISHLLDRYPHGLSGGEAQRVSLARALAFRPKILLLDEPLSALDEETREQMYDVVRRVREHTGVTGLHVTHSQHEAKRLADRVLVADAGQVSEATLGQTQSKPTH